MQGWSDRIADIFSGNFTRTFMVDDMRGRIFTYSDVLRLAASGAESLQRLGVHPSDRVGLDLPNGAEFAILYFSCLLGGFTAVPLNSALPRKDCDFILEKSRLKILLQALIPGWNASDYGEPDHAPAGRCPTVRVPAIDAVDSPDGADEHAFNWQLRTSADPNDLRELSQDALLSMTFTSGTTSLPKGVLHSARSLLLNADSFNRKCGLGQARFLHVMPMAYMAGFLNTLLCPFMAEGSVVLAPQFSAASALRFWEPILQHKPNMAWMAPTMLTTLLKVDRDGRGRGYCQNNEMRIFSGTAPLPAKVRSDFEARYSIPVIESYGLSELLLITANLGPAGQKDNSVGITLPEVTCEARDAEGGTLRTGFVGEIFVKTPFRMIGYLDYGTGKSIALDAEWTATGDIGYVDDDGYVFITDRSKDLVIRGGHNISPRSIEEVLIQHSAVDDAAVFGVPHDFYGEELVAAVIMRTGFSIEEIRKVLADMCRVQLGPSMVPDKLIALASFPRNTTGKVQKHLLRQVHMER